MVLAYLLRHLDSVLPMVGLLDFSGVPGQGFARSCELLVLVTIIGNVIVLPSRYLRLFSS